MYTLSDYGLNERFIKEATQYPDLILSRIIAQYKGLYKIVTMQGETLAEVSGKFRYNTTTLSLYPAVGDYVMVSGLDKEERAVIHHILTRKSAFERTAVGVSGQSQVVASNIDIIFLCMSLNNNYNLSRMERYLSIAWSSGATPAILLTKSDLCENVQERLSEIEQISAFADVVITSAFNEDACAKILEYVKGGSTASFIGSSGVGKSTLINRLMGKTIMVTAEIGKLDKGRHTTTGREMLMLSNGGIVIDTPGMREIGVESVDLSKSFSDIERLEEHCKFNDCTHTSEPGCAVLKALANGEIEKRRLDNYFKLKREAKYDGLSSKEIETIKYNEMFKEVGGMKNMRKHNPQNNKKK